jgi:hypothetical protein
MNAKFGYRGMKLLMRRQGDPIAGALAGSPDTDPSVVAFVEQLRVAAGAEELVQVTPPLDAITDAATAGSNPEYSDLQPVRHPLHRRVWRFAAAAGLATKVLFGAAAIAAVATTAAVTGTLPDGVQDFVSDSVDGVGIGIPRGHDETGPPTELPVPSSPVPGERIEYRDAVIEHNICVQEARSAFMTENGNAAGFDSEAACGERPDPKDFDRPAAPGQVDNPSQTRPPATSGPSDSPSETRPTSPVKP